MWVEVLSLIQIHFDWRGNSVEDALSSWWQDEGAQNHKVVPLIISWGIWIAINEVIFKNKSSSPGDIASKAAGIITFFSNSFHFNS